MRKIDSKTKLGDVLANLPRANATWQDITPLARKEWLLWIKTAKKSETRIRRIEKACDMLASGKRRPCCFGGMNWLIKMDQQNKSKSGK